MKRIGFAAVFLLAVALSFGENFSFSLSLNGNAHIVSWQTMSKLHEMKKNGQITSLSADGLYNYFQDLRKSSGGNELLYDKKREDQVNTLINIYGNVAKVRRSILDEYIVELNTRDALFDVCVVFPKNISPAMVEELLSLRQGDSFSAIAFTRSFYTYVDVCVWNNNGVYRTEP